MAVSMTPQMQAEIRILPGNDRCVDCGGNHPQWASVTYGALMCLECSGAHRGMGVHISFVRSVTMDSWNDKQLKMMTNSSNADLQAFWRKHGVDPKMPHNAKYHEPASTLYADRLKAKVEGRPLPTKLPERQAAPASAYDAPAGAGMSAGGFGGGDAKGSEAMKGESTEQYVARQRRLQAEARERMRRKFGNQGGMGGVGSNSDYDPRTGTYGGGSGGFGGLAAGNISLDNVQGALGQGVGALGSGLGKLKSFGSQLAEDDAVKELGGKASEVTSNAWGGLKRWGSTLSDKVRDLTVQDPDPSDLGSALRRNGLGAGKQMDGLGGGGGGFGSAQGGFGGGGAARDGFGGGGGGLPPRHGGFGSEQSMGGFGSSTSLGGDGDMPRASSNRSFSSNGSGGYRDAPSPVPPAAPTRTSSASPVPPPAPPPSRSVSAPAAKKPPAKEIDFFGDFGM